MKHRVRGGAAAGGGGGKWRIPSEEEVEVIGILVNLPKLFAKSELLSRYSFTWGRKKKRSVLVSKSESSPSTSPLTHRLINDTLPEKLTATVADKSPTTPLCFLASGSGSDGGDKPKHLSSVKTNLKRKATNDLTERYNGMQQEREILLRKLHGMKTLHQELTSQNLELKAKQQKINYPKNIEDIQLRNASMKLKFDQQRYHQQITGFTRPPLPPQQRCQQFVVDRNGKLVPVTCSSNSNGGGRFGLFNQIDPRVNMIHGEAYNFMASSQPLDQNKYMVTDNDLRARNAATARKHRIMRMKENRKSFSDQNRIRFSVIDNDSTVKTAADARKRRVMLMKENKNC